MTDSPSHTFPTAEELAALLPPYEIHSCIYTGVSSAIYFARQTALERMVMIRVMPEPPPELAPQLLERLRKRARLVDPRIVSVFDFGRTVAGPLYLVTEYVDGNLLQTLLQEKLVTPKYAFQLANQLCDTLQMVHDLGIVHGALSVITVLATRDWQLKLTGIGMSETAEGELSWMEESTATFADDIRALGSVIHEMFSGEPPVAGQLSDSLPPAFAKVIERCLTNDPAVQYQRPQDVRLALNEALRAEKKAAEPVKKTVVSPAAAARPAVVAAAAPAVVAAAASAAPAPAPKPQAPPKVLPGRPPPRVAPPPPPSLKKRIDNFLWSTLRTSLHLTIFGVTALVMGAVLLFKDKIVVVNPDDDSAPTSSLTSSAPAKGMEDARRPVKPNLGALPAAPVLGTRPPPKPLSPRDAKYVTAIKKEIDAARQAKRTEDLTALRRELQRVQGGKGVPAKDEANLSATVKHLRDDYRKGNS